jgi:hypothetical protein
MSAHPAAVLRFLPPFLPQALSAKHAIVCLSAAALLTATSHTGDAESGPHTPVVTMAPAQEQLPLQGDRPPVPALDADMRKALGYTARRYRVSPEALEPIFVAAQRVAHEAGIDPLLVIAVIGVESSFNPLAASVMGAQGLMQVIPRYHADKLQREAPAGEAATLALFDPVINVRVGTRILQEYIRTSGGITEGLQQYVGAVDDPDQGYAGKVLGELERLETAARRKGDASV